MTEDEAEEKYDMYEDSAKKDGLNPISAVYNAEKGFAYCQTEADSAEQVRAAHEKVNIPLEDVMEIIKLD
ncbi:DUF4242 domain-containing protein [Patescibacteria group bacterium]|nr:DUF4242 domain-containing protein [Patescibacteria group bacterium]